MRPLIQAHTVGHPEQVELGPRASSSTREFRRPWELLWEKGKSPELRGSLART